MVVDEISIFSFVDFFDFLFDWDVFFDTVLDRLELFPKYENPSACLLFYNYKRYNKAIHVKDNVIYYYLVWIRSQRLQNRKTIDILHSLESDDSLLLSEDADESEFTCESEEFDLRE